MTDQPDADPGGLDRFLATMTEAMRAHLDQPHKAQPPPEPLPLPEDITSQFSDLNAWDTVYRSRELGLVVKVKTVRAPTTTAHIFYHVTAAVCGEDGKALRHPGHPSGFYIGETHPLTVQSGSRIELQHELEQVHAKVVAQLEHHGHHDRQHATLTIRCGQARIGPEGQRLAIEPILRPLSLPAHAIPNEA